jgi:large subunit ribosomal protein L1
MRGPRSRAEEVNTPAAKSVRAVAGPRAGPLTTNSEESQEQSMKRSKAYRKALENVDVNRLYTPGEAVALAKTTSTTKFDATVEVSFRLGVDPRKADQMVRGTVNLPNGTGKTARVLVFATGERAEEARAAGADFVGADELIERVQGGFLDFDAVVATPDLMGKVGRLGRVLGPRSLMPNPKTGTVTMDVGKAVTDIKGGKIEFRVDKNSNLHLIIGKASFTDLALVENYAAAIDEVIRLKPAAAKGRYVKKIAITTTMGPGIQVDPGMTRGLTAELTEQPAAV